MDITSRLKQAVRARRSLNTLDETSINRILKMVARSAIDNSGYILRANEKDIVLMEESDPRCDRLMLTRERIGSIAGDILKVADLPFPSGKILKKTTRPNGLRVSKVAVPFGVIGIIYESRPNVTFDVFSLCLKSGNVCILKGGSEAINSNRAIVRVIKGVLGKSGVDPAIITLLPAGRSETTQLLNARPYVDLIIPRGSRSLIDFVRENSSIPVIETGAGICHTYFDESGDKGKGRLVINNAKTRRVSVCNALDCLIIHEKRLKDLPALVSLCSGSSVIIYADTKAFSALKGKYPDTLLKKAVRESFGTEFLSYRMAVKTVKSFEEALNHIERYGSRHSEAIISEDQDRIALFFSLVDASSIYSNTSTAFTDGSEFGLGAEIGISTQKLHARGPMALEELTTYKWIIEGNGQIRN